MYKLRLTFLVLFIAFLSMPAFASEIDMENAWIREAPPVSHVQAGYVTFINNQTTELTLVEASSAAFKSIEFHKTVEENGAFKMFYFPSITIPHDKPVDFKPGGLHLMLFNPVKPLHAGEKVDITFKFKNGLSTTTQFIVKK